MPAARRAAAIIAGVMSLDRRTAWTAVPKMLVFSTSGIASSARIAATARRRDFQNRPRGEDLFQLFDRAERGQPAGLDDRDAVTVLRLVEVVRGHEDREPARQIVDQPPELPARQRVDTAGRLVEEDDRRLVEDRAAEREPLPPAAESAPVKCSRPRRPAMSRTNARRAASRPRSSP